MENQEEEIILVGVAEESPESPPVAEQPGVPVVVIDIPLRLDVEEPVGSPPHPAESPSPGLSDDVEVFMNIYDRAEFPTSPGLDGAYQYYAGWGWIRGCVADHIGEA